MSRSTDPDHFFQTTTSLAETSRKALKSKNAHGRPIRLQSKILAIIADPVHSSAVYVAESAGTARRVLLDDSGETTHIYRGPTTPLTSLALSPSPTDATLFAGSWEKSVWSWSAATRERKRHYYGHTDFVKALLCLRLSGVDVLISGSADASIIVWKVETGEKLFTLKGGHTRGILDLAIDPTTYPISPSTLGEMEMEVEGQAVTVFSAGSDREIRRWRVSYDLASAQEIETEKPIIQHETSVYNLYFDADDDLWTASADGSVKCLVRERDWTADTTLVHGDYVRGVVLDERGGLVISAGRDEEVRIWDRGTEKLHHTFSGHFEEITGLVMLGQTVVTVSIDTTIRRWSLKPEDLGKAVDEAEARNGVLKEEVKVEEKHFLVTEDEERELAELMEE